MTACREYDLSLSLRAAGALDPAEAARLEAHLEACPACRAEAEADAEVLSLAKLPPVSDAERRALADLPKRALAELRRSDGLAERRRRLGKRIAFGIVAAAAAVIVMYAPGRERPPDPRAQAPVATADATWESPDLDTVWADAGVLDLSDSAEDGDGTDAAFAALDVE
jgi:anti-sigma factor RsiW